MKTGKLLKRPPPFRAVNENVEAGWAEYEQKTVMFFIFVYLYAHVEFVDKYFDFFNAMFMEI